MSLLKGPQLLPFQPCLLGTRSGAEGASQVSCKTAFPRIKYSTTGLLTCVAAA